jgi:N-acetylglucosamine malate deacetylase 1
VIEKNTETLLPDIVYTHHLGDLNIDHRRTHEAVVTACRPLPGCSVHTLLFFEVASSGEFQTPGSAALFMPNWFNDISETLSLKLEVLEAYHMEMCQWSHARSLKSLEALAHWRGVSIGAHAAESFVLGRLINH